MASTNLDFVQSLYAAWGRGDFFSSAEWADPKIEFVIADGPDPVKWTGLAAMAEGMRDRLRNFEGWRIAADEYRGSMTSACSCSFATAAGARPAGWM
jgi:hypothetical protein